MLGIVGAAHLFIEVRDYRQFHTEKLRALYADGASARELTRANDLILRALMEAGPQAAHGQAMRALADGAVRSPANPVGP